MKTKLAFFGGGKMAEGIICAALSAGFEPANITVAEKSGERAAYLRGKYKVATVPDAASASRAARTGVLAVKPQDVDSLAQGVKGRLPRGFLLVSIAAGKTVAALSRAFGKGPRIVRVMPNLPLVAGEGMCAIAGGKTATENDLLFVERILRRAGKTIRLGEKAFDAVTALSGSGPAFFAYMESAMAGAGAALGLPRGAASLLARQTMAGTAAYLRQTGATCERFIADVSSKGGTTAAGMEKLAEGGVFASIVEKTLRAAAERSKELAGA